MDCETFAIIVERRDDMNRLTNYCKQQAWSKTEKRMKCFIHPILHVVWC